MAGRNDNYGRRGKGGGNRRVPPPVHEDGFGNPNLGLGRYSKKTETYNPIEVYEAAIKSSEAEIPKEKKHQKTKFVNLYGDQGQERLVMKLPGRNECECQASMHGLVNNCLKCGRIVCEQEGSGPCFFCSGLVCSRDEQRVMDQGGKRAEELRAKLLLLPKPKPTSTKVAEESMLLKDEKEENPKKTKGGGSSKAKSSASNASPTSNLSSEKDYDKGLEKAKAEKDRLLDYQRNKAQRTQVFDDQSDYFSTGSNPWLSDEQREKLRKREEELRAAQNLPRSQRKIMLDLGARQIVEEQPLVNLYDSNDAVVQEVYFGHMPSTNPIHAVEGLPPDDIHRPGFFRPTYESGTVQGSSDIPQVFHDAKLDSARVQDGAFQNVTDRGRCLSMHQPYGTLLVRGIKKHEGRSWYTTHRGPLWIASAAKQPTKEDIEHVENFYRHFYNDVLPASLPSQYPVSCLLGCVDVVDCVPQEQYQLLYPGGESESPYVWICENFRELSTFFPVRGEHKIYKLDPNIHQAAKRMINTSSSNTQ